MERADRCTPNNVLCFAEDLLERWERRDAARAAVPELPAPQPHVECLPCLLQDWDSDLAVDAGL